MLYNQHKRIVKDHQIKIFQDFLNLPDQHVDDRGNVYNKLMTLDLPGWPVDELRNILDQVLSEPYVIENADFVRMKFHSRLHTDTADGDQRKLYKNVIIPLEANGDAATAIFPNRWFGPAAKFSREHIAQFEYTLTDTQGQEVFIEDIRDLSQVLESVPGPVEYQGHRFDTDRIWLKDLIRKRHSVDARVSDYNGISGLNDRLFPEEFRLKYLAHIPAKNLHGLGQPDIAEWTVGDVITFDRQLLHAGTSNLQVSKSFLAVFTYHA